MFNMGTSLAELCKDLQSYVTLGRAVETGTFRGDTSVALSAVFPEVVTIELASQLHERAVARFAAEAPNVQALQGDSGTVLRDLPSSSTATLYFLDGHWSTGQTAGAGKECPVIEELAAIAGRHPEDCVIIDDARLFAASPPPPHDAAQWPTLMELFDTLRAEYPEHYVTLVADQIIAVPARAKPAVDRYAQATYSWTGSAIDLARRASMKVRMAVGR